MAVSTSRRSIPPCATSTASWHDGCIGSSSPSDATSDERITGWRTLCAGSPICSRSLEPSVWARPNNGSRMRREPHVRFCERAAVKLRRATHLVITISGHWSKRGWAERALQRTLRVELNREKTKMVDTLKGEAFGFLGFDLRRVHKRKNGRDTTSSGAGGATPVAVIVARVNAVVAGWVNYFRVGNSSRAFSEVRDYLEMKIRTLLTRRKRRRKTSIGWWRWSNAYVYGVLGLYSDWKIHPLPSATAYA